MKYIKNVFKIIIILLLEGLPITIKVDRIFSPKRVFSGCIKGYLILIFLFLSFLSHKPTLFNAFILILTGKITLKDLNNGLEISLIDFILPNKFLLKFL